MGASRRILLLLIALALLLLFLAVPGVSWADTWEDVARQLARKIVASVAPQQSVGLAVQNASSLDAAEVAQVRAVLEEELRSQGVRLVNAPPADAEVRVTLSENVQGYLWVAEIRRGEALDVAMVALKGVVAIERPRSRPSVLIRKEFVWEQAEPMLDAVFPFTPEGATPVMVVLEPSRVAMYKFDKESWQLDQSFPLTRSRAQPRDPHGRLVVSEDEITAALQGDSCNVFLRSPGRVDCQALQYEWPRRPDEIVDAAGKNTPPWHSFASLDVGERSVQIIAGIDGRARLYEEGAEPVATFDGWGSDLTDLYSDCSGGEQLLVTGNGDWSESDTLQAYEIVNREAVAVSPPVEFPGPVMALWPAGDLETAVAISRNFKTGRYEVYRLSITCGR